MKILLLFFIFFSSFLFAEEMGHECGVALVRLRQPIEYYAKKYGDPAWGTKKLLLLMEKQRNRGQDGAGISVMQFDMPQGMEYLHQLRSAHDNSLDIIIGKVMGDLRRLEKTVKPIELKYQSPYIGEALLGHLRYATSATNQIRYCQPFVRLHYTPHTSFALAGNFNMANTTELFTQLADLGLSATNTSDTAAICDSISYHLDRAYLPLSHSNETRLEEIFQAVAANWDGGYVLCGLIGTGDIFACRDPAGIRPGYYTSNDEFVAVASEKIALMEAFNIPEKEILPIKPGHIMVMKRSGECSEALFTPLLPERQCTFERIYFSKASDAEIYRERKALGRNLASRIFEELGRDLSHVVFTYVPNSSISAFQGVVEEIARLSQKENSHRLQQEEDIAIHPQVEYIITKNQKLRSFIASDQNRSALITQLYEVTSGVIGPEDTLVVIDDSIVRGATLRDSLAPKLIQLNPKKIIFVSSAPPVLFPDCYGIDMSQLGRFVGFQAALELLKERGKDSILKDVYEKCIQQIYLPADRITNELKHIYACFSLEEISDKVAQLITPPDTDWKGTIQVIYQSLEGLSNSMPGFSGDWYFSGNYPTPGGFKTLNNSYIKWYNQDDSRSY